MAILPTEQQLIEQGSRPEDIKSIDNQFFYDRSGADPEYVRSIYDYYMGGYEMPGSAGDIAAEAALVPGVTAPVASDQGQGTGTTPTVDTTFQDAGATDVSGTIGTLNKLTTPTTIDQLDYTDAPTTVPALNLSGTSTDLISQGVIETPQEFYGRTYDTSPSEYEFLDNEERQVVDEEYATAYNLAPVPEKATTLTDIINLSPAVQVGKAAIDFLTPDESVSEGIDFNTYADPSIDAEENQPTNIENIVSTEPNVVSEIPEIDYLPNPDEITEGLTYPETTSPVQWSESDDLENDAAALEAAEKKAEDAPDAFTSLGEEEGRQKYSDELNWRDQAQHTSGSPVQWSESDDLESDAGALETALGVSPATYEVPAPAYTYEESDGDTGAPTGVDAGTADVQDYADTYEPASEWESVDEGTADEQSGSGGNTGGGVCVIATHAVDSGAFTPETKREAVRWCIKNLHRTWWGEAVRKGYRYYGQKAIEEGKAKNHYQEFKDYVAFGTGRKRTLKTAWTFVYRTIQFFIKGITIKDAKR